MAKRKGPFEPCIAGVGYRKGPHRSTHRAYKIWAHMLHRCYNPTDPAYKDYGAKGVTVHTDWHNYQNYAEWFKEHEKPGHQVDKDKLGDGTIYSAATCCFLTRQENMEVSFAKTYSLRSPEGNIITFHNLQKFARNNGLVASNILKVLNGSYSHTGGWTKPDAFD